jgi:lipoprotein-releasing system permease protein
LVTWISLISVVGISLITAALVILLAAFNGIESMVNKLYSEYDAGITIRSNQGKTFDSTTVNISELRQMDHVKSISKAIEETVILKNQKKWVNARMVGVDFSFLEACSIDKHMVDGFPSLEENGNPTGIIGATLLDKIDGYISALDGYQELMLYAPLRDASIGRRKSPFKISPIRVVGRMNYNKDVNASELLVPIDYARIQLDYDQDITALYVDVEQQFAAEVKANLTRKLGSNFKVKTAAEKNELIFKTSESEKKIVVLILLFIFILAAFNLVASLNMLYVEKAENMQTMVYFGAEPKHIFLIFFFEGLLISFVGILIGLTLGAGVCLAQDYGHFLLMPGTFDPFPIILNWSDLIWIFFMVFGLSTLMSYFPVRYLVKKDF